MLVLFLFDSLCELHQGKDVAVCPELREMPLPSSKRLWEASNRDVWKMEYGRLLKTQYGSKGALKLEDLWGLEVGGERMEEWVAEMDGLGSAVLSVSMSAHEEIRS